MMQDGLVQLFRIWVALVLVFSGGLRGVQAQGLDRGAGQLMLLKNGNVLQGFVERTAQHYRIQTRPGNRLVLAFDKVEMIADSLSEIYWRRLTLIGAANTDEQEVLFQWCLKYKLWDEARNQLEIFQALNIEPTKIQRLQLRLEQSIKADWVAQESNRPAESGKPHSLESPAVDTETSRSADAAQNRQSAMNHSSDSTRELVTLNSSNFWVAGPLANNSSFFENYEPLFQPLPSIAQQQAQHQSIPAVENRSSVAMSELDSKGTVIQVGYEAVELNSAGEADLALDLSVHQLEKLIRGLPPNSLTQFRSRVEPVLITHCSDCHQSDSTAPMRLLLRNKRTTPTVRMSQRNLHAVLLSVDGMQTDASPFLIAATTAHGGAVQASLQPDSAQFQALREWVEYVSSDLQDSTEQAVVPAVPATSEVAAEQVAEPRRIQPTGAAQLLNLSQDSTTVSNSDRSGPNSFKPVEIRHNENLQPLTPKLPSIGEIPTLNQRADRFVPRDDFDPEIFNRNFRKPRPDAKFGRPGIAPN